MQPSPFPSADASLSVWARQVSAAHAAFWRDWLTICRVNKIHALEFIVERALLCVAAGKFAEAAMLTLPVPALRPLVVLTSWDQLRGIESRQKLLQALSDEGSVC